MGLSSVLRRVVFGQPRAVKMVEPPPPPEPWTKIVSRDYLRDRTRQDGEEVYARIMEEREELLLVEKEGRREMRAEALDVLYPRLDLQFLSWKWLGGRTPPRFAVFGLDDPTCRIGWINGRYSRRPSPRFREDSSPLVVRLYRHFAFGAIESTLEAQFGGIIPPPVREVIKREKGTDHFEDLGIIAEVQQWKRIIPAGDPLLVGLVEDQAWLLASFDTTSTEDYVVGMFTK